MGGKGHGHDPTEKVSCAHKYRKGCDVDGRKMQPWMMIAIGTLFQFIPNPI